MKGILLAGGRGSRLYPVTRAVSKHLLPVYDKPMFYYPLCTLMQAGIRDILFIANKNDIPLFKSLLGDGAALGLSLSYAAQPFALGIADALRVGRDFIGNDRVALILGDNLFLESSPRAQFSSLLKLAADAQDAVIFTTPVEHPEAYGVAEVDKNRRVLSLEEKPAHPRSHLAVPGLYFYPGDCANIAQTLQPSVRGELEITDVNKTYLQRGQLRALPLPTHMHWLDTGTCAGLLNAINLVAQLQRNGTAMGCIEQTAARMGFIAPSALKTLAADLRGTDYGNALIKWSQEVADV